MKKILYLFILFYSCVFFFFIPAQAEEITEINRTLNQNWMTKEEYNKEVEEAANKINADNNEVSALITVYPERLDPRETGQVTSVKNQDPYGTCWSYGTIAAAESALIKQGFADNTIDLSELQYIYEYWKDKHGTYEYDLAFNMGATVLQVWEYMSKGIGPYYEESFGSPADYSGNDFSEDLMYSHLYDLDYIDYDGYSSANNTAYLKKIITKYGGAAISYYSGNAKYYLSNPVSADNDDYNNTGDSTYYCPHNITIINHAVEVVGWDDNYPASNFAYEPEGDGAWLIKGSWGNNYKADFDEDESTYLESHNEEKAASSGYYWISYYESSIMNVAGVGVCFTEPDTKSKSIETDYDELNLTVGDTFVIEATVLPETATNKTLKFTSSDKTIASIKSTTGKLTARKAGSCIISITNTGGTIYNDETDGIITKTITVNITNPGEEDTETNTSEETTTTEEITSEEITTTEEITTSEEQTSEDITTTENTTTEASSIIPESNTTEVKTTGDISPIKEEKTTEVEKTISTETAIKEETPINADIQTAVDVAPTAPEITVSNLKLSRVVIKKLKKYKSKKLKVSYKKVTGATKYEIQVSNKKNFKKKNIYYSKKLQVITNDIKRNKTYYIRVRAVYENNKIKIYGKWSKIKKIKIK